MIKELKALKRIEDFMSKNAVHWKQDIAMIETALKNYEEMILDYKKKLEALEIIKELFDFDFALRFGSNQPMFMIINKRTNEYWELPISKEKYDSLKGVLS